jgi:hypothetical protein
VTLYSDPPERMLVLSVDGKSQITSPSSAQLRLRNPISSSMIAFGPIGTCPGLERDPSGLNRAGIPKGDLV